MLSGVKSVVLDLDGTLYNKQGLSRRMVRRLWWSLPLMAVDRLARGCWWRGITRTRWYRRIYLPTMVRLIGQYCPRREEVLDLIRECHRQGIPLAVYSDYSCIEDKLVVLGIDARWFAVLADSPSLGARKPSREAAMEVLRRLKAEPATTLFVGDRDDTDGETARMIGARFLLIS